LGLAVLALVGSARCSACRRPPGGVGRMSPTAPERPSPPNERLSHGTGRPRTSSWRRAPDPLGTTSSGYLGHRRRLRVRTRGCRHPLTASGLRHPRPRCGHRKNRRRGCWPQWAAPRDRADATPPLPAGNGAGWGFWFLGMWIPL